MAGGDGSLAIVAQAALAHDLPFACVPAGTRNHFARDLGLDPADPTAALDALSDGVEGRIDVGEVNGRVFLNNVSLGIYAEAVRRRGVSRREGAHAGRDRARPSSAEAPRSPDWTSSTTLATAIPILRSCSCPTIPTRLSGPLARGARPTLSGGRLGIIVIDRPAPGRRPPGRAWSSASLRVDASRQRVHAGIDGEAVELSSPLEFAIRPAALRVRAPRRGPFRRRQRSSAATASGARATPLTDPAIASSG